jgi:hypothetical protein
MRALYSGDNGKIRGHDAAPVLEFDLALGMHRECSPSYFSFSNNIVYLSPTSTCFAGGVVLKLLAHRVLQNLGRRPGVSRLVVSCSCMLLCYRYSYARHCLHSVMCLIGVAIINSNTFFILCFLVVFHISTLVSIYTPPQKSRQYFAPSQVEHVIMRPFYWQIS